MDKWPYLSQSVNLTIIFSCMSQKAELPSLTGHRTKTRKRDEKKIYGNYYILYSFEDFVSASAVEALIKY